MPETPDVEAIVFDLGGVLLEVSFGHVFASWAHSAGTAVETVRDRFRFDSAYERHERGEITATEYFAALRESLALDLSDTQFAAGWNECVRGEIPGVAALVEQAAATHPLYVFSNTNAMHYGHWGPAHRQFLKPFRRLFMSYEMGLRKPEVPAFEHIAREIGVELPRILFFDDTEENVHAASALRMQTVQVRSVEDLRTALARLAV